MKKIKVSHEVPFFLLKKSRKFNDYDYCLPHLMDENEEYRNFFYESKEMGRYIVMDNSLHELGEAYNSERLIHWVNEIKPEEFIVPDVWEDMEKSIENAQFWSQIELPEGVVKVAVVQAKNIREAEKCVNSYLKLGYKKIAFSYGASYYNEICPHPNKDLGKAIGRYMVVNSLYKMGILKSFDRVHLLGTAWPAEFGMYKNIECIESIDTSNPIMAGIEYTEYGDLGISTKPKVNMNFTQDRQLTDVQLYTIQHNIEQFKKINQL